MAQLINEALKNFVDEQPLPTKFYAQSARKAAKEIETIAHTTFEGELLKRADALVSALYDYAEELDRD